MHFDCLLNKKVNPMRNKTLLLALLPFLVFFSCNSSSEEDDEPQFTATINEENWEFYDLTASRNGEDVEIVGKGYLNGDRGAVPVDLSMTLVALPEPAQIETPYTAYFAPNTQGRAVFATIDPIDQDHVFDTKLDPNAIGTFVINEVNGNSISGEFSFIAVDKVGRKLEVTDGEFNNLIL